MKLLAQVWVKQLLVKILVVVANNGRTCAVYRFYGLLRVWSVFSEPLLCTMLFT